METVLAFTLRPLPPEPPVKVGNFYMLTRNSDGQVFVGRVREVYSEKQEFFLDYIGMFSWDDPNVTITRLVPEQRGKGG
jgi:hypothetical protein